MIHTCSATGQRTQLQKIHSTMKNLLKQRSINNLEFYTRPAVPIQSSRSKSFANLLNGSRSQTKLATVSGSLGQIPNESRVQIARYNDLMDMVDMYGADAEESEEFWVAVHQKALAAPTMASLSPSRPGMLLLSRLQQSIADLKLQHARLNKLEKRLCEEVQQLKRLAKK